MTSDIGTQATGSATPEVTFFDDPALDLFAGLIFELAAQLHEERAARIALQSALLDAGLIDPAALSAAAEQPTARAGIRAELERSLASLLRILSQRDDARAPLAGDQAIAETGERRS